MNDERCLGCLVWRDGSLLEREVQVVVEVRSHFGVVEDVVC